MTPINLNAGTLHPTPLPVLQAAESLRRRMATRPSDFMWREGPARLEASRRALAGYLRADPGRLLLLPNVTFAMNLAVSSLELPAGSEILATDQEYGAMRLLLRRHAERRGWTIREVPLPIESEDPLDHVRAVERAISTTTAALFFSHVTSPTGLVLPSGPIVRLARERGLVCIVDGAHAPGMIEVQLDALDADFYGANCHKWIMAPAEAAFLHVAERVRDRLVPLVASWGLDHDPSRRDLPHPMAGGSHWQFLHEFHGTTDRTPQMVIPEVLEFRRSLGGEEAIRARHRELTTHARRALESAGLRCVTPRNPQLFGAMLAAELPAGLDPEAWRERIWREHAIECPATRSSGRTWLRVSCSVFNNESEINRLVDAATAMLA